MTPATATFKWGEFNRNHQAFLRISPLRSCQLYHSGHECSRFAGSWKAQTNGHCAPAVPLPSSQARQRPETVNIGVFVPAVTHREAGMCQANSISDSNFNTMQRWDGDKYRDLWSLQPECLMEQGGAVRTCHYEEWVLLDWGWIFLAEVSSTSRGKIWKWERVSQRFDFVALTMWTILQGTGPVLGRKREHSQEKFIRIR